MATLYSVACEHAILAMTYIAAHDGHGRFCLLRDITDACRLPRHFMGKICRDLVRAGLLRSVKGRGGGFALRRTPEDIRVLDIIEAIDGRTDLDRCIVGMRRCDNEQRCPLHDAWVIAREQLHQSLFRITLQEMVRNVDRANAALRRSSGLDQYA